MVLFFFGRFALAWAERRLGSVLILIGGESSRSYHMIII
jgi:hypothetical protein